MKNAIFINGNRTGYGPDQMEDRTCTVEDLISMLKELGEAYGMNTKVFIRNDNGYTYGEIKRWDGDVYSGKYDDETVEVEEW